MLKNYFDGLLSIFIILSFAFLVVGNIGQFVYWIKHHKTKRDTGMQYLYLDFWRNEWGQECTKEEMEELHWQLPPIHRRTPSGLNRQPELAANQTTVF